MTAIIRMILIGALSAACANQEVTTKPLPTNAKWQPQASLLPSNAELEVYVALHWEDFGTRVARFAKREGEQSAIRSLHNAECQPDQIKDVFRCSFSVAAKFEDGSIVDQLLYGQFM